MTDYAVIAQHFGATSAIKAQTLFVVIDNELIEFTRDNASNRGASGAWYQADPVRNRNVPVLGQPVSVAITDNDLIDFKRWHNSEGMPDTLFQKSTRKVRDYTVPSPKSLADLQTELIDKHHRGESFDLYVRGRVVASTPSVTIQTAPSPAPVAPTPAVTTPTPQPVAQPAGSAPQLFVPTQEEVTGYQPRTKLYGSLDETVVYDTARVSQQNVSIIGPAGTGKTSSVRHYAHLRQLPFVAVECDIALDETQTEGSYVPTGNGNEVAWQYSALATAIQQPSVVLLNELSRLAPKNASLFLGLLQERKLIIGQRSGEVLSVHPECLIVADMNPQGYSGVSKQDQALLDRFHIAVEYDYDLSIDRLYCKSETFITEVVDKYRVNNESDPTLTPFSHRLVKNFQFQTEQFGLEPAVRMLLNRFDTDSRDAVRLLIQSNLVNIAQELGIDHANINLD